LKKVELMIAAGPVGTVKKPSVVGEALFKPRWESAFFCGFPARRPFPQAIFFLCVGFELSFPQKFGVRIA